MQRIKYWPNVCVVVALIALLVTSSIATAEIDQVRIRLANSSPSGEIVNVVLRDFAEALKERSDGKIDVRLYTDGVLGSDRELIEQTSMGTLEMTVSGWVGLPAFHAAYLPYVFEDNYHLVDVMHDFLGEILNQTWLDTQGIRLVGYFVRSPRQLTANKPIEVPEDASGIKIRVPEVDQYLDAWRACGALPTPLAFTELFSSLQTGVVDAQENPVELIYSSSFQEVQDYLILIDYIRAPYFAGVNDNWWNTLSQATQDLILEELHKAELEIIRLVEEMAEEYITMLENAGMTVIRPDIELWRDVMFNQVSIPYAERAWGEGVLDRIQEY